MSEQLTELVQFRVSKDQKRMLKRASKATGVPISVLIRSFTFAFLEDVAQGHVRHTFDLLTVLKLLPDIPRPLPRETPEEER